MRNLRFGLQNTDSAGRLKPSTSEPLSSDQANSTFTAPPSPTIHRLILPRLYPYQRSLLDDRARDVCTVSATQIGKTVAETSWLLAYAWEHPTVIHPYWWLAPTYNQIRTGFRYFVALASSAGVISSAPVLSPFPRVKLVNGSVIEFRSWEREQNLMGDPIAGGVVDEAGLLTPHAQGAISSRRSATMGPLHYIGNPGVSAGPFRRLCTLGEQAAMPGNEWAGVYSLHRWTWLDKHAVLLETDPSRAEEYARFIGQEKQSLPDFEFRRLYEAEWTEDEAAVFRGLRDPDGPALDRPVDGERYVIGVDVAQQTDYLVATVLGINRRRVHAMERWRGVPYPMSADRLAQIASKWDAPLVIEINGPGLPLFQELQQRGVACAPFTTTAPTKQEIIVKLASELEHGRLALADVPPLHHELRSFRYQRMPSGNYRYEAPSGEHDDCVMSLAFALWGAGSTPDFDMSGWI